jgi:hypothetical protein
LHRAAETIKPPGITFFVYDHDNLSSRSRDGIFRCFRDWFDEDILLPESPEVFAQMKASVLYTLRENR